MEDKIYSISADINTSKLGTRVTKNGCSVRFIGKIVTESKYNIVLAIEVTKGKEIVGLYSDEGEHETISYFDISTGYEIGWINVYTDNTTSGVIYDSMDKAAKSIDPSRELESMVIVKKPI